MTMTDEQLEHRLVATLRAKSAQAPEAPGEFETTLVTLEPVGPRRKRRVLLVAAAVLAVIAVVAGIVALRPGHDAAKPATPAPAPPPVGHVEVHALPSLTFQAREFATVAGRNDIQFESEGGTHALVFEDPTLSDVKLPASSDGSRHGTSSAVVDLVAGRSYTIFCTIPGHRQAGMEATIHVYASTPPPDASQLSTTTTSLAPTTPTAPSAGR